jgi:hypothetical protein
MAGRMVKKHLLGIVLLFGSIAPGGLSAGNLERVLMPGDVIAAHAKTESNCSACHQAFDKSSQSALCGNCHKDIAADIRARKGFHGRAGRQECKSCHTDHKGRTARIVKLDTKTFRHDQTDFILSGGHKTAACTACHVKPAKYRDAPSACIACHRKDDAHKASLGTDCARCHGSEDWKQARFDHAGAGFTLRGRHATVECVGCHVGPLDQQKLPQTCVGCHKADDAHKGGLGATCGNCHTESGWRETRFDHSKTGYPLLGRHLQADCSGCHRTPNVYQGAAKTCMGCHKSDDRHLGTLGTDCQACHQPQAWKPARGFDHAKTRFPLIGKHQQAACLGCHAAPDRYHDTARACVDCHRKDDTHKGRNGDQCASCHDAKSWTTASFDHSRLTKFPLLGAHGRTACTSCHTGYLYKDKLDTRCIACHRDEDAHKGKLGESCERCHSAEDWKKAEVDHDATSFPLLGQHRSATCAACHKTQAFDETPEKCSGCHADDDVHQGRMGAQCETCHSARDWRLWDFDHAKRTSFAITGAHIVLKCESCHVLQKVNSLKLSDTCGSCHTGDDIHNGSFGMSCERCHSTTSFKDALKR